MAEGMIPKWKIETQIRKLNDRIYRLEKLKIERDALLRLLAVPSAEFKAPPVDTIVPQE